MTRLYKNYAIPVWTDEENVEMATRVLIRDDFSNILSNSVSRPGLERRILSQPMETVQWQGLDVAAGRTSFVKESSITLVEGGPPHWYLRSGRPSFSSFSSFSSLVEWVERQVLPLLPRESCLLLLLEQIAEW
jgi:hypothetical protein